MAELIIYEAAVECSEYCAENMYINHSNLIMPDVLMGNYLDDKDATKFVSGGMGGISFLGSRYDGEDVIVLLNYRIKINVPFISKLTKDRKITIRQKAYTGYGQSEENTDSDDEYVYVTDNQEVYHSSRTCTHLCLSISGCSYDNARKMGYKKCGFCGESSGGTVYITESGDKYHNSKRCSGLKRSIRRVKKKDVENLAGCSRCVN